MATRTTSAKAVSGVAAGGGLDGDGAAAGVTRQRGDFRGELEGDALLFEDALEALGDVAVHAGQDAVEIFDDLDFGAEAAPDRAEFEADDAGADDEQFAGHERQREGSGGGDDLLLVDVDAGQAGDVGAGGDDDGFGFEVFGGAAGVGDLDAAGGEDAASAEVHVDLVLLQEERDALDVALHALVLEGEHLGEIEFRLCRDAHAGEAVAGFLVEFRRVQQGFRRDAADVEARAAVCRALLDDGDFQAELGGANGADVAAGAGADDDEVVGHALGFVFRFRLVRRRLGQAFQRDPTTTNAALAMLGRATLDPTYMLDFIRSFTVPARSVADLPGTLSHAPRTSRRPCRRRCGGRS